MYERMNNPMNNVEEGIMVFNVLARVQEFESNKFCFKETLEIVPKNYTPVNQVIFTQGRYKAS